MKNERGTVEQKDMRYIEIKHEMVNICPNINNNFQLK